MSRVTRLLAVGTGIALVGVAAAPLAASVPAPYPRPGTVERVSVASDGGEADGYSAYPSLSDDGRYVAFDSDATNLVPGDTNGVNDIFVHDRATGRTERVSLSAGGEQASGPTYLARIDGSGRFVQFLGSGALAPGNPGFGSQVILRDRETETTERVSVSSQGQTANGLSFPGDTTPDGRFVAFDSFASNLAPGDANDKSDVFVRDRETGITERVSLREDGKERVGDSYSPSISDDGRYVAYTALVGTQGEDNDGFIDEMQVFWHDRDIGEVRLVSVSDEGERGNGFSGQPEISADGRFVAFRSQAQNLVPADANGVQDIFVHDVQARRTERVSVSSAGAEANASSSSFSMSADGRHIAFLTTADNLVEGDTNARRDVYLHDRLTKGTERISLGWDGRQSSSHTESPFVSADGRHVAFAAYGPEFVPGDTNNTRDVFVRDRGPALGPGSLSVERNDDTVRLSGWATFSGAVVSQTTDPADDGGPGAAALGAELTGAGIVYRPEAGDLMVQLRVASLPGARPPQASGLAIACALLGACGPGVAGAPAVTYGLGFDLDGVRHEVRAERGGAPVADGAFVLHRCEDACLPVTTLEGSIGTTGYEIRMSVPLSELGATEGARLSDVEAFTGLGHAAGAPTVSLDTAALPDASIPHRIVELAVTPAETPGEDVEPDAAALLSIGAFEGELSLRHLQEGPLVAWARACLGEECGALSAPVPGS